MHPCLLYSYVLYLYPCLPLHLHLSPSLPHSPTLPLPPIHCLIMHSPSIRFRLIVLLLTCYIHYSYSCLAFVATGSTTCGQCAWRDTLVRTPLNRLRLSWTKMHNFARDWRRPDTDTWSPFLTPMTLLLSILHIITVCTYNPSGMSATSLNTLIS